jgi:hypothetical protein
VIGLTAVFGRNHGVYGVLGSIGAMLYLSMERGASSVSAGLRWWLVGVVTGYFPIITCLIVCPGFAGAFWESIRFLLENKGTNLPLPLPWPWRVDFEQHWTEAARGMLVGLFFIAIPVFGILGLGSLVRARIKNTVVPPVLAATILLALPYAHFAYSRAEISHLAQGIFPFLIAALVLAMRGSRVVGLVGTILMLVASVVVMLPQHPAWQFYRARNWLNIDVAGDKLTVDPGTASDVALLSKLVEKYARNGRAFVATPYWPGAYAVFARKSPMWDIYALFPRSEGFQQREIERIKQANSGFVLVLDHALDGREELRFRNTHPLIDRYVKENYESLSDVGSNRPLQVYLNKQIGQ